MNDQSSPVILYSEPDLTKEFSVSRTPVHEALIELSSGGFLKLLPWNASRKAAEKPGSQFSVLNAVLRKTPK